ncbi:MAG TPA: hypothetical protein ENK10_00615 [Acidobacteria bacterium]|nr:hypothetical protein [Acidobacteriota bacterium]
MALKILAPERVSDPAFAERFAREARTLARLSHPQIVGVYDVGETGDLMALDSERPGRLRVAASATDPGVVGVAVGPARGGGLDVPIAAFGIVGLKVDAGYGEIRPGDLLVSSPTPGHAMRALEVVPGSIVGKALEPLDFGTGVIRVLLMPR